MKHIFDIDMVRPGMQLAETIKDYNAGATLIAAGTTLTERHIDILKRRNIDELTVNLTKEEKIKYQYDNNIIPTVNRSVIKGSVRAIRGINGIKEVDEEAIEDVIEHAKKIVDSILLDANFTYKLTDYKMNTEPSEHSVRTATYAVALANAYNKKIDKIETLTEESKRKRKIDLENIAIAALLHDIGKLCADEKVRKGIKSYSFFGDSFPGITKDKYFDLQENYDEKFVSYYGYHIANEIDALKTRSSVKAMILVSSEDEAGLGPLKMQQNLISSNASHIMGAKMINICSRFDEYMMENLKDKVSLEKVQYDLFKLFLENRFNKELLKDFIETIPLYPKGTKVLLEGSISGYAVVEVNFADPINYSKPILLTIPDKKYVDLRKTTDTVIKQVIGDEIQMYSLYMAGGDIESFEEESARKRA
nr:HD domain-containing protein [Bacilli bacterium]